MLGVVFPVGGGGNDDDANDDVASSSTTEKTKEPGVEPTSSSSVWGGWEDAGIASSPPSSHAIAVVVSRPPTDEDAIARCLALSVDSHVQGDGSAMVAFVPVVARRKADWLLHSDIGMSRTNYLLLIKEAELHTAMKDQESIKMIGARFDMPWRLCTRNTSCITRINKINILINHPKAFLFNVE